MDLMHETKKKNSTGDAKRTMPAAPRDLQPTSQKSDFSVSSIIGLKDSSKRTSTDERDSIGSSVGSDSGDSTTVASPLETRHHNNRRENTDASPPLRSRGFSPGGDVRDGVVGEDDASRSSDEDAGMSSGDSGLLKDINENHKEEEEEEGDPRRNRETGDPEQHSGKYISMGEAENPYYNDKHQQQHQQQSDLSALQKLYSLESMQRFTESRPVFPGREPYGGTTAVHQPTNLPSYDKPLMIDVGPGRSFTTPGSAARMLGDATNGDTGSNRPMEGEKIKKKAVVREAVDPAKYVRIQDLEGIKFACSKCGNTYKWRKSLNKHWKEKHDGEIPTPHGHQNLITLNIPQVKGKTTNINTALFSYAPLGAGVQTSTAGFHPHHGTGMPVMAAGGNKPGRDGKEQHPPPHPPHPHQGYPSAEMLSKYEELSKQWMSFANAAAVAAVAGGSRNFQDGADAGRYSQKNAENHNSLKRSSPGVKPQLLSAHPPKNSTPTAPRSRSETPSRSTPPTTGSSGHVGTPPVFPGNPFFLAAVAPPPPAHSQGYRPGAVMDDDDNAADAADCDEATPLDLSSYSKRSSSSHRQHHQKEAPSDVRARLPDAALDLKPESPRSDHILDFSSSKRTPPTPPLGGSTGTVKPEVDDEKDHFRKTSAQAGLYTCVVCSHPFNSMSDLNQHFAIFHIDVIYEKTFSYGTSDNGGGGKTEDGTFACIICGSKYLYQIEVLQHFEKNHAMLPCPYRKRAASPGSLAEPPGKRPRDDVMRLQCSQCGFFARDPTELTTHHMVHSLNRPYACTRCGYSTKHQEDLFKHVSKYHTAGDEPRILGAGTEVFMDKPQEILVSPEDTTRFGAGAMRKAPGSGGGGPGRGSSVSPDSGFGSAGSKRSGGGGGGGPAGVKRAAGVGAAPGTGSTSAEILLPYKCSACEYRARWPSEITQHMKNHSDEKPFHCPRCTYKSKWKWDVVKHLKRCGGGTVKDVIDTTKLNPGNHPSNGNGKGPHWVKALQFKDPSLTPPPNGVGCTPNGSKLSGGPPNVTVLPSGVVKPSNNPPSGGERHLTQSPPSPHTPDQHLSHHQSLISYKRPDVGSPSSSNTPGSVVKGMSNGLYHCLHCPFIGNSPAELKRHTRVHSDEKPFSCLTCGYSSKWKCDLKKHIRTYNHESAVNIDSKSDGGGGDGGSSDDQLQSPSDGGVFYAGQYEGFEPEAEDLSGGLVGGVGGAGSVNPMAASLTKQLYKCDHCQYGTYKKNFLDTHMKIHEQPGFRSKLNSLGGNHKLRCKTCGYDAPDLSGFLQHQLKHNIQQNATTPDATRMVQDGGEDGVEDERASPSHVPDEIDVFGGTPSKHRRKPVKQFRCARCPYTCFKRSGLEQHQSMHEPREGSLVCKYCDYNVYSRSLLGQHMRLHPEYMQEAGDATDEDEGLITQDEEDGVLNLSGIGVAAGAAIRNSSVFPGQTEEERRYPCEWCDATFTQLSELYQHARAAHPAEYEAQEAAYHEDTGSAGIFSPDGAIDNNADFDDFTTSNGSAYPQHKDDMGNKTSTAGGVRMGKRKRKLLTCPDCGYTTDNSANLARHAVKHGQNAMYQCHYCNYSLNRQGLVIAHMKQVHNITVTALPRRSNNNNSAVDFGAGVDENEPEVEPETGGHMTRADNVFEDPDNHHLETVSVKGETLLMHQSGKRKTYKCPKCSYVTDNSSHGVNHVRHHGSNKRYNCEFCDYSLDKLPHIILHMKAAHAQHINGGYTVEDHEAREPQQQQQQKVEPLVLSLNGLDAKKHPKRLQEPSFQHTNGNNTRSALSVAKKHGQAVGKKHPKIKNRLLKKALAVFNAGNRKNGLVGKKTRKSMRKRMSCSLCRYHTNNSGLLQNHLLQHNAFAAV